ncbi:T9SS type A sorting domain-containing protein [Altibacter sp.]|uniref:T9SS type A sorting domain-containing protein n=1 Tax=Altibacter sp. TaxID=2024823 RepID=UPI000C971BB0|nr:T9SS type A sorting domain-containing protein [Altibacter sp.]MAP55329.1 hypothetical protein [Altibacter sp.]
MDIITKISCSIASAVTAVLMCLPFNVQSQTWEDLGNLSVGGNEVGFVDSIEGHTTGLYICSDLGVFRTTDTGNTFSNLTYENGATTGLRFYCVFIDPEDNTIYIGGDSAIYKSTNNGGSWTVTGLTGSQKINGIARSNGNLVASYGDTFGSGGAYYSADGFATFTQSSGLPDLRMIGFYTQDNLLFLAGEDGVYGSTDDGVSWAVQGTGTEDISTGVTFIKNQTTIFVADRDGSGLYKTEDQGATWFETDPVTFDGFCQVFDMVLANGVIYVVTDGTGCANNTETIKISTDNGVSWSSGMFNLSLAYYAKLGATVEGCVFTYAPFEDKLYRLCDGPLEVVDNTAAKIVAVPNPTNGSIQFPGLQDADVEVYDVQGKRLMNKQHVNAQTTLNLEELQNGIYFIHIQEDTINQTIKILKQ